MTTTERSIHRGISDFALWSLVKTQGSAILAGRSVTLLEAKPSMVQREGWFNVKVRDNETAAESWMDVTTMEYEQREESLRAMQKKRKADRKKRQTF
jgi:hypothetical protein